MKKIMIAAAVVALAGGAFAVDGSAYQVRFNLRTVDGVTVTCTKEATGCVMCGESESSSNIYYYRPLTRNLKAILARCIECGESITNLNNYVFAMWEEAYNFNYTKKMGADADRAIKLFQDTGTYALTNYTDTAWEVKQFGSKGQYVSIEGFLNQNLLCPYAPYTYDNSIDLSFIGFGDSRTSDSRIGQVSGSVIGHLHPVHGGNWLDKATTICVAFDDICKYKALENDGGKTRNWDHVPAYGNWTMRSVDGARDMTVKEILGNGYSIIK